MKLAGLLSVIRQSLTYQALLNTFESDVPSVRGSNQSLGIPKPARPYLLSALSTHLNRPIIVAVARAARAVELHSHLRHWLPSSIVTLFPEPDPLPYEKVHWSAETTLNRLSSLAALAPFFASPMTRKEADQREAPIIVCSVRTLVGMTVPRREFLLGLRSLRQGQQVNLPRLLENWVAVGFRPAKVVEEPGTFSRRGGIVDIFPPNERWPIRIELFGDEIESLRQFDPANQRSIQQVPGVVIAPASEALPKFGPAAAERLAATDLANCHPIAESDFRADREHLAAGQMIRGIEFYLPYLYSQPGHLLDYLPERGLLVVEESTDLEQSARELSSKAEESRIMAIRSGDLPANFADALLPWNAVHGRLLERQDLELGYGSGESAIETLDEPVDEPGALGAVFSTVPLFGGRLKQVLETVREMTRAGSRMVIVSRQHHRLVELFRQHNQPFQEVEELREEPPPGIITSLRGTLSEGWMLGALDRSRDVSQPPTVLLTDAELFGWSKPGGRLHRKRKGYSPESFFADVAPDDFVVHIEHGIGIYRGLVKLSVDEIDREYLQVDYAAGDRLFIPVHQADRLVRFVGAGEAGPTLNRLGTSEWENIKERTKQAVREIARELLELYATRAQIQGHAFQPDTVWQHDLEDAFPYIETHDQITAISEVKADMEQSRPMDRLICGDVGYGKTEVALRSAFKAVMDGKQVAVLVPTTVLAQQHFKRFQERLSAFPVNVEMLSRFRSPGEQEQILSDLSAGRVDIIIGTHRLIQQDVTFKDLGLVIIDEEQRFGVAHKEQLKQLRKEVDVLTLTATPIPRTLHLSLSGIRDLSTIDTPPEERLPIRTVLAEYDETLIRQAILRELERGGQVYFVHNRVRGIEQLANKLRQLVPEAEFAVSHGQMQEKQLSQVMWDFANGTYDVLVTTTIIESGIDIPNVNTIIINQADHFGLAQLYQLRGRVGRGAVRAYAYLLHNKHHPLDPVARRRLEAIVNANELGAGFRIAMEDLEIRGAGEILGARQSGHITAVGLDLYSRLLNEAIRELREGVCVGEKEKGNGGDRRRFPHEEVIGAEGPMVLIDLPLSAFIPASYVAEESLRLQLYRRLAEVTTVSEIEEITTELRDRFGPPAEEVTNLLYQLRLKSAALQAGVTAIVREDGQIVVRAPILERVDREGLQHRLGYGPRVARRHILIPLDDSQAWKETLVQILSELSVLS